MIARITVSQRSTGKTPVAGPGFCFGTGRRRNVFHVERHRLWGEISDSAGAPVTEDVLERLDIFRNWLVDEAVGAGGIGPGEIERIDRRHIADSLLFSLVMPRDTDRVLDVGTGVGLPGVPLAILHPATHFTLLDRSQRRVDLARRAVRILDLDNVEVERGQVPGHAGTYPVVVSRASIPPDELRDPLAGLLESGGVGLVGGSWRHRPRHDGYVAEEIGSAFLAQDVWILIMRQ